MSIFQFIHKYKSKLLCLLLIIASLLAVATQSTVNNDLRKILELEHIPMHIYVAIHDLDTWAGSNPYGYYLFIENNIQTNERRVEVRSSSQNLILEANYSLIGNGVFELSGKQGFVILNRDGLKLDLSVENKMIPYTEFRFRD